MRRGRLGSLIPRALCGGALRDYCGSLTGDSKRGRAAAPLLVVSRYPPSGGRAEGATRRPCVCANRSPGPQRRAGRASRDDLQIVPFLLVKEGLAKRRLCRRSTLLARVGVLSRARTFQVRTLPASLPRNDHRTPATSVGPPIP